jgi:iron complex outermembrane receptor protein
MRKINYIALVAACMAYGLVLGGAANAEQFNISSGDLRGALKAYTEQTGVTLLVSDMAIRGVRTTGVKGDLSADDALAHLLAGTGFKARHDDGVIAVIRDERAQSEANILNIAAAPAPSASGAALETVTVTSSKIGGDVQNIPISITALSQEQLTQTQTAGGPDLVKQVPNLTFSKTNFTGYNIQIRGIGTQAISVTTDPAVAVALNDIPFLRNHFFEQEFYDLSQAEVLRGPQGTLYGRNATAGVVNLVTAKPSDQFEAMASGELGNYQQRRFEGMINVPIVDDRLDLRVAGEWTKRQGYSFNAINNDRIDGRDLWSSRVTLAWNPSSDLKTTLLWEHFSEDDDRMRTSKQLCKTAPSATEVGGVSVLANNFNVENPALEPLNYLSQGCEQSSLYSPDAFEVPNGLALPYTTAIGELNSFVRPPPFSAYANTVQSQNLRVIETAINPRYQAKNDTLEFNTDYNVTPTLTFTSQTGYNNDFLWSAEDYNRFNTAPGFFDTGDPIFSDNPWQTNLVSRDPSGAAHCIINDASIGSTCYGLPAGGACTPNTSTVDGDCIPDGIFCDPQLGCSGRLVAEDLSDERSWQFSQEFRLSSNFSGPFNFSVGGNFLHYETEENYYVFINSLTSAAGDTLGGGPNTAARQAQWIPGVSDNSQCLLGGFSNSDPLGPHNPITGTEFQGSNCAYIDPNPITRVNNKGHNYFLSQNPYTLNSYAGFGEVYYNVFPDLKLTTGLRWTDDEKHFTDIPSELLVPGYGYASTGVVNQTWNQWTGREAVNWTPKLDFTDQTLFYGSYAHGYKAGGANPPGAVLLTYGSQDIANPIHPLTFKPEFVDAFELGTKNTLLDGALTLNGDVFYYNYENYQISRIVDRTSINDNFDAHVKGAELEASWEPLAGLRLNFAGGYEDARAAKGDQSVDLMDRTAGNPNWIVVKPFVTQASNCVMPIYVAAAMINPIFEGVGRNAQNLAFSCGEAYNSHDDPLELRTYVPDPEPGYPGFDPLAGTPGDPYTGQNVDNGIDYGPAPNNGQGFDKNLSGNHLPNAPPFTVSAGAQYTLPLTTDWAGTLRGDYYWQDYSWARIFNDNPYDRIRGYTNVNITLIFTSQSGWQVMLYDKNLFNTTAITGDFLNSDDSGLTTNVFLTDPRLVGIRVTKNW